MLRRSFMGMVAGVIPIGLMKRGKPSLSLYQKTWRRVFRVRMRGTLKNNLPTNLADALSDLRMRVGENGYDEICRQICKQGIESHVRTRSHLGMSQGGSISE